MREQERKSGWYQARGGFELGATKYWWYVAFVYRINDLLPMLTNGEIPTKPHSDNVYLGTYIHVVIGWDEDMWMRPPEIKFGSSSFRIIKFGISLYQLYQIFSWHE